MYIDEHSEKPIYLQIYEQLEDAIFTGGFPEETQIPSTTEISTMYRINPATVLKGMNILVQEELLYKKRGLGMFVVTGAREKIRQKRQQEFFKTYVDSLLKEAEKLALTKEQVIQLIERGYEK